MLRHGSGRRRSRSLAWHAWRDTEQGHWPLGYPLDERPSLLAGEIRHWLTVFVQRFYSFAQFKRSALPERAQGVRRWGRCRHARDWRAPSDMSARIWLDEIDRNVPPE